MCVTTTPEIIEKDSGNSENLDEWALEDLSEEELTDYRLELRNYYISCLILEGSKVIVFAIIFAYMHRMKDFLMALFVLMLLRNHGGGLHLKHYFSCLLLSFTVLCAGIIIPQYIHLPFLILLLLLVLCSIVGYLTVPIVSKYRPEPPKAQILRSKNITLIIISVFTCLICMYPDNHYMHISIWIIYIHILQLLIAKFVRKKGGRKHEFFQ